MAFSRPTFFFAVSLTKQMVASLLWPFAKERFTAFGLHLSVGFCFGVLPVYLVTTLALGPPNDASARRFLLV